MRCLLLLLGLVAICLANDSNCEKNYDACLTSTTGDNTESIAGWLSKGYAKVLDSNLCLDLFQTCKKTTKS